MPIFPKNKNFMLDSNYWNERYLKNDFPWDIGYASTPLVNYFSQIKDKSKKILIPGAGNAHEAAWLFDNGFLNVYVLDIAAEPIKKFSEKFPQFPKNQLILSDFFEHNEQYDLIIEQTFFCALIPDLREKYALKMKKLLAENGKLVGLLFNAELNIDRPPFGGFKSEYERLFSTLFKLKVLEKCYNSIGPRDGKELFFIFEA